MPLVPKPRLGNGRFLPLVPKPRLGNGRFCFLNICCDDTEAEQIGDNRRGSDTAHFSAAENFPHGLSCPYEGQNFFKIFFPGHFNDIARYFLETDGQENILILNFFFQIRCFLRHTAGSEQKRFVVRVDRVRNIAFLRVKFELSLILFCQSKKSLLMFQPSGSGCDQFSFQNLHSADFFFIRILDKKLSAEAVKFGNP